MALLRPHFGKDTTVAEIGRAFSVIDADGSRTIDWAEMVAASKAYLAALKAAEMAMTPEGVASLKRLFDRIDSDSSGAISRKEWGAAVGKQATRADMQSYFGGINAKESGKMFAHLDVDKGGSLTFDEFVAGSAAYGVRRRVADVMATEHNRAELRALFEQIDTDGDGCVDSREWGRAVSRHGFAMSKYFGGVTPSQIGKAFRKIDADGSNTLTWDEFERFVGVR